MQSLIRTLFIVCLTVAGTSQAKHMDDKTIDERTQPVGKVRIEGMPTAAEASQPDAQEAAVSKEPVMAEATPANIATSPADTSGAGRSGEELYNTFCIACHSVGLANAPKFGDEAAWSKVLEVGIDAVIASAKKGKNVMPPKGTCMDCSDNEFKNAIQFMSGQNLP
ncbi:MAG: cytochrome c5 family protein [Gammaproteobacteria bacterium]|nr:cytochrome c5 family protein [Gammaproteobacteria bacterium]